MYIVYVTKFLNNDQGYVNVPKSEIITWRIVRASASNSPDARLDRAKRKFFIVRSFCGALNSSATIGFNSWGRVIFFARAQIFFDHCVNQKVDARQSENIWDPWVADLHM